MERTDTSSFDSFPMDGAGETSEFVSDGGSAVSSLDRPSANDTSKAREEILKQIKEVELSPAFVELRSAILRSPITFFGCVGVGYLAGGAISKAGYFGSIGPARVKLASALLGSLLGIKVAERQVDNVRARVDPNNAMGEKIRLLSLQYSMLTCGKNSTTSNVGSSSSFGSSNVGSGSVGSGSADFNSTGKNL